MAHTSWTIRWKQLPDLSLYKPDLKALSILILVSVPFKYIMATVTPPVLLVMDPLVQNALVVEDCSLILPMECVLLAQLIFILMLLVIHAHLSAKVVR